MSRYRKRPVEIEAVQMPEVTGDVRFDMASIAPAPRWVHDAIAGGLLTQSDCGGWHVNTLEGRMLARPGDYLIRGVKGELYPCKPDIFEAIYELVAA